MAGLPKFILRDCAVFVDRRDKIGQSNEITLPVPTEKNEQLRNSGMVFEIDVPMGYEKPEFSFKLTAFDPQVIPLFGLKVGQIREFMATGALVHEDGKVINATAYIRGRLTKNDHGTWKTGAAGENAFSISARYYKLEVGGKPLVEMDPFEVKIGGVSQTSEIRDALLA